MSTSQEDLLKFCVQFYTNLRKDQLRMSEEELLQQFLESQQYLIEMISFRKDLEKEIEINAIEQIHKDTIAEMLQTIKQQQGLITQLSQKIHQVENEALHNLNHSSGISSNITKPDDPNYQAIFQEIASLKRAIDNIEPVIQVKNATLSDSFQEQLNDQRQYLSLLQNVHRNRLFQFQLKKNMFQQSKYSQQLCWKQGQDLIDSLLNLKQNQITKQQLYNNSNKEQIINKLQKQLSQKQQIIVIYEQKLQQLNETIKTKMKLQQNKQKQNSEVIKKKQKQIQLIKSEKQKTIQQLKNIQIMLENKLNTLCVEKKQMQAQLAQKQSKLKEYAQKLLEKQNECQKIKQKRDKYEKQNKQLKKEIQKIDNQNKKMLENHKQYILTQTNKKKQQQQGYSKQVQQLNQLLNEQKLHSQIIQDQLRLQISNQNKEISKIQKQSKQKQNKLKQITNEFNLKQKQLVQVHKQNTFLENQIIMMKNSLQEEKNKVMEKQKIWKMKQTQMRQQYIATIQQNNKYTTIKQQQLHEQQKINNILQQKVTDLQQNQTQLKQIINENQHILQQMKIFAEEEQHTLLRNLQKTLQEQLHADWKQKISMLDQQMERISNLI